MLVESLQAAGLDTHRLAALGKQHDAELRRAVAKYRAEAVRRSRKRGPHYLSVLGQCKVLVDAADQTTSVSLTKPFLIWATPRSNILSNSQVAPSDSWAKFRVSSSGEDSYRVSFYFLWTNPYNTFVVIDPITFVIAAGYIEADADRSYLTPNVSNVSVDAEFSLWQWWLPSPEPILSASASLGHKSAVASPSASTVIRGRPSPTSRVAISTWLARSSLSRLCSYRSEKRGQLPGEFGHD